MKQRITVTVDSDSYQLLKSGRDGRGRQVY